MRCATLFAAFALTIVWPTANAFAQSCPRPDERATVSVRVLDSGVHLDHTRSQGELGAIASQQGLGSPGTIRGITAAPELLAQTSVRVMTRSSGGDSCAHPVSVEVVIGWRQQQIIYVQRDYPVGSCQYSVVYRHEQGHAQVNIDTLRETARLLEDGLRAAVNHSSYPIRVPSELWARDNISSSMRDVTRGYVAAFARARTERNQMLDTPQNYRATSLLCPSW